MWQRISKCILFQSSLVLLLKEWLWDSWVFLLVESRLAQASRRCCQPLLSQETGVVLTHHALFPLPWAAAESNNIFTEKLGSVAGTVGSCSETGLHRKAGLMGQALQPCCPGTAALPSAMSVHADGVTAWDLAHTSQSIDQVAFDCLLTRTSKIFKLNLTHLGYIRPTSFR